ncbi:unnamed protein product [Caenorhabditis auriculariae]|uniref:Phosphodiesterase n=1 Tax=Caenorhabditis auriculariae TaxID=2777116 RepID=A0A8S1GQC4_9PELO|nr:unnamed protein product [Caenorhabditis auriculariae]
MASGKEPTQTSRGSVGMASVAETDTRESFVVLGGVLEKQRALRAHATELMREYCRRRRASSVGTSRIINSIKSSVGSGGGGGGGTTRRAQSLSKAMRWCCGGSEGPPTTPLLPSTTINAAAAATSHAYDQFGPMSIKLYKSALLVTEGVSEGPLTESLRAAGWTTVVCTASQAEAMFEELWPTLVLFDLRIADVCHVAKALSSISREEVLFVGVSEREVSEKRRRSISQSNILHVVQWSTRETGLFDFLAKMSNRLRVLPALFTALDEADQAVEVCDESKLVQYVNRAYEAVTGCIRTEVIGQPESEMRRKSLPRAREESYERRRSTDWRCIRVPTHSVNKQYVYLKRPNTGSDAAIFRDVSLKSLKSQAGIVEAPISEVLSLLRDAAARVDGEPAQLVRDAVRVLSSHELYAPSITRFRDSDRIATQYYDGLIRLHHPARQRKKSVVDAYREKRESSGSHGERRRVSADVKNALENDNCWSFDVLLLEKVSEYHALSQLGMKVYERWKVNDVLGANIETLNRWLMTIEAHYHAGNTYHNATHAADVLQATSFFLDSPSVAAHVNESHAVAAILAATVHDLDHPGRGNAFLINTRQSLAVLYNDHSVLENHHIALAFQLTFQPSADVNIFSNMNREEFISMRHAMIEMVLATDISRHFEYLAKFNKMNVVDVMEEERETNSLTICDMLVKCADISNPTREWSLCQRWGFRIVEEYFEQTREEREKGLPITMEVFDRNTCNVPITQCGFIDMFAREAFCTLHGVCAAAGAEQAAGGELRPLEGPDELLDPRPQRQSPPLEVYGP